MKASLIILSSEYISPEINEDFQLFACEKKFPVLTDPNIPREIFILGKDTNIKDLEQISEGKNIYFYSLCQMCENSKLYFLNKLNKGVLHSVIDHLFSLSGQSDSEFLCKGLYFSIITDYRNLLIEEKSLSEEFKNK